MKTRLQNIWHSRSPLEKSIVAAVALALVVGLYSWLVLSASQARGQLRNSVSVLRAQAVRLEHHVVEIERLRGAPSIAVSKTDLRTLVQDQAVTAGLSPALTRLDAVDASQVVAVFGAVAFADWLNWIDHLSSQHVRLEGCRIESLSTPGLVSVTATLTRAKSR